MASHRKPLGVPRFGSQSSQTDNMKHNQRRCKLSKNMKKVTCESSPFTLPGGKSPEVTPCYSRKVRTNYLLRFYCSVKTNRKTARKSTDTLMADSGKSQTAEKLTQSKGENVQSIQSNKCRTVFHTIVMFALLFTGTSSDYFEFPWEDVEATDEKVSLVQYGSFETTLIFIIKTCCILTCLFQSRTKQEVLRTIKKMTEENKVIRERLLVLSQMSQSD